MKRFVKLEYEKEESCIIPHPISHPHLNRSFLSHRKTRCLSKNRDITPTHFVINITSPRPPGEGGSAPIIRKAQATVEMK